MKALKLTPSKKEFITNKFIVKVTFMHGDADAYTSETYTCKDEDDFRRVVDKLNDAPQNPAEGGDECKYKEWELDTFGFEDFIPWDITGYDCPASFDDYECFFYDENGVEFMVEI